MGGGCLRSSLSIEANRAGALNQARRGPERRDQEVARSPRAAEGKPLVRRPRADRVRDLLSLVSESSCLLPQD